MNTGIAHKMSITQTESSSHLTYSLRLSDHKIPLNCLLGQKITLTHTGHKMCIACGRDIKKTFQQGYCYPCTLKLAETDICIVKPELCHHHKGTCRSEEFAQSHCFIEHVVYLANCSGAKVGITRGYNTLTRWADQGALQALVIARVGSRIESGKLEREIGNHLSDRTNWRRMLSESVEPIDLQSLRDEIKTKIDPVWHSHFVDESPVTLNFPVQKFPNKISSHDFDKNPEFSGTLCGLKGQYIIMENAVMNLRKYQGYEIVFSTI